MKPDATFTGKLLMDAIRGKDIGVGQFGKIYHYTNEYWDKKKGSEKLTLKERLKNKYIM